MIERIYVLCQKCQEISAFSAVYFIVRVSGIEKESGDRSQIIRLESFLLFPVLGMCYITFTMKWSRKIIILITLAGFLSIMTPGSSWATDVTIRVTFIAGGVAGGVYFLFYLSTGDISEWQHDLTEKTALFNHDPGGWKLGYPQLKFVENDRSSPTPYIEIIKIRF